MNTFWAIGDLYYDPVLPLINLYENNYPPRKEDLIRISENTLVHYQKVFLVIVSDNSKLTVIKSGKYETKSKCDCMKESSASSAHLDRKTKKYNRK